MTPAETYLARARGLIDAVGAQLPQISQAADWFAGTILAHPLAKLYATVGPA